MRPSSIPTPRTSLRFCSALGVLGCVVVLGGCSRKPVKEIEIDCSVEDPYEFASPPIQSYEDTDEITWFGFGDNTPGAFHNHDPAGFPGVRPELNERQEIENGGRCGSKYAVRFVSEDHQDWGAGFGTWKLLQSSGYGALEPADGRDWDGISFWARSPGASDKAVTVEFPDLRTRDWIGEIPRDAEGNIVEVVDGRAVIRLPADEANELLNRDCVPIAEIQQYVSIEELAETVQVIDRAGGRTELDTAEICACHPEPEGTDVIVIMDSDGNYIGTEGEVDPLQCGNSFKRILETTREWQFYAWPFESLWQEPQANRKDGMVISNIYAMALAIAKGLKIDLWIDDVRFYRKRRPEPDAAVDDTSEPDSTSEPDVTSEPDANGPDAGTGG